jgi:hypothetical protein
MEGSEFVIVEADEEDEGEDEQPEYLRDPHIDAVYGEAIDMDIVPE